MLDQNLAMAEQDLLCSDKFTEHIWVTISSSAIVLCYCSLTHTHEQANMHKHKNTQSRDIYVYVLEYEKTIISVLHKLYSTECFGLCFGVIKTLIYIHVRMLNFITQKTLAERFVKCKWNTWEKPLKIIIRQKKWW